MKPSHIQKIRERRRFRAIKALETGMTQTRVAAMYETTCASVSNWAMRFRTGGIEGLKARPVGRPSRVRRAGRLDRVRRAVMAHRPEEFGLFGALWTWRNVQALVFHTCKIEMSRWTVTRHLRDWGLAPPEVDGAFASADATSGRTLCDLGCTDLASEGTLARCALWSVGRRGEAAFAVYPAPLTASDLIDFLERMHRHIGAPLVVRGPAALLNMIEPGGWRTSRRREILLETGFTDRMPSSAAAKRGGRK